ncbi:MAG: hypothetical protein ACLF0G_17680, partial [Candidatus Brocadiia bacterium]
MLRRAFLPFASLLILAVAAAPAQAAFVGEDVGTPGNPSVAGSTVEGPPGTYTITGSGSDVWGNADHFHFYHDTWSGNFEAICRVNSLTGSDSWRKGGIMARDGLDADAVNVAARSTPGQGSRKVGLQWRDSTGAGSGSTDLPNASSGTQPVWLKLSRNFYQFSASWAPDVGGAPGTWSDTRTRNSMNMPSEVELGLWVTSHNNGEESVAEIDNFQINAPPPPSLPVSYRLEGRNLGSGGTWLYLAESNNETGTPLDSGQGVLTGTFDVPVDGTARYAHVAGESSEAEPYVVATFTAPMGYGFVETGSRHLVTDTAHWKAAGGYAFFEDFDFDAAATAPVSRGPAGGPAGGTL